MPDSGITKRALAASLKELMAEKPFEKISVAQICERCSMNRKSFYYHFRDKYDQVNWIFDTEFIALLKNEDLGTDYEERWALIEKISYYFYQNRAFYSKALQIKGQPSFSDHFRKYIQSLIADRISSLLGKGDIDRFALDFLSDAAICTMERWLLAEECMPPEQFVKKLKNLTEKCAHSICREMPETEQGSS